MGRTGQLVVMMKSDDDIGLEIATQAVIWSDDSQPGRRTSSPGAIQGEGWRASKGNREQKIPGSSYLWHRFQTRLGQDDLETIRSLRSSGFSGDPTVFPEHGKEQRDRADRGVALTSKPNYYLAVEHKKRDNLC